MDEVSSWVNSNVDDTSMDDDDITLDAEMESDGIEVEAVVGKEKEDDNVARIKNTVDENCMNQDDSEDAYDSDEAKDADDPVDPYSPSFPDFRDYPHVRDTRDNNNVVQNNPKNPKYSPVHPPVPNIPSGDDNDYAYSVCSDNNVVSNIPDNPNYPHVPDVPGDDNVVMDYGTSVIFTQYHDIKYAGKKVNWWKTDISTATRGLWMAQYLLIKMRHMSFHDRLKKDDFVKVKMALRDVDLAFIRNETMNHRQTTDWAYNGVVQEQVLNFRVLHNDGELWQQKATLSSQFCEHIGRPAIYREGFVRALLL